MKVGMLAIGNELLDGMVQESNSGFAARELFARGHSLERVILVKDDPDAIVAALKNLSEFGFIITSGGLGPTEDDLTRECAASFAGVPLYRDESLVSGIRKRFEHMRIVMPESNKKQADRPSGSTIIPNPRGTAPGFILKCPERNTVIASLPGVPSELENMFPFVLESLDQLSTPKVQFVSVYFKTIGEAESLLNDKIKQAGGPDLQFGTIAQQGMVTVRLDLPVKDKELALKSANELLSKIPDVQRFVFTMDRTETIYQAVIRLLVQRKMTVMIAESCTGGLVSKLFTDVPGSSQVFLGGIVTYDNTIKEKLLGVNPDTLKNKGAVSFETAGEMLKGISERNNSDYALSITGIAGPDGGTAEKPVGTVYIGLKTPRQSMIFHFQSQRNQGFHQTADRNPDF